MLTRQTKVILSLILALIPIGCLILTRYHTGVATIIFTIAGISAGIVPLLPEKPDSSTSKSTAQFAGYLLYITAFIILCNWVVNIFRVHIHSSPISQMTDMLLVIQEMCDRYLHGQSVYVPISDIHGLSIQVVYLPGFFLPFCIPRALHLDIRWLSLIAYIGALVSIVAVRRSAFRLSHLSLLTAAGAFTYLVTAGAAFYFMHTQEALILLYVGILAWALIHEYWWAAGMAAGACLMSRYFIFIPLGAGIIWLYMADRAAALRSAAGALIAILVILGISCTWGDIPHFMHIPFLYRDMLMNTESISQFRHIYSGSVGFAWFCDAGSLHIISAVNTAVIIGVPILYFVLVKRLFPSAAPGTVLLCGVQIFVVCFLTTLPLPFGYVVYTAAFLSIFMLRAAVHPLWVD